MNAPGDVVVLNGPPAAGKSTIAARLRARLPGTVVIEGDALRAFTPADARDHLGGGSTYRAAAALVHAYLSMGARRVIFDYVFLRRTHVAHFHDALGAVDVRFLTLWAPLATVTAREAVRPGRARLGDAVHECYEEMARNLAHLGRVIPNDSEDVEPTIAQIEACLTPRTPPPLPSP